MTTTTTTNTSKARLALRCWARRELTWTELQAELAAAGCSTEQAEALAKELGL